jgi:3-dehydroquinate synthase
LRDIDVRVALGDFQEHLGGDLTITLPAGIGDKIEVHAIDAGLMSRCIDLLEERGNQRYERRKKHARAAAPPCLAMEVGGSGSLCRGSAASGAVLG